MTAAQSFASQLPEEKELQNEQTAVRDSIVNSTVTWQVVMVQGVAGSGKTTVALHALKSLVIGQRSRLQAGMTPIYVTQSSELVEQCRNILSNDPDLKSTKDEWLAPTEQVCRGKVNLITAANLFKRLHNNQQNNILDDAECRQIVAELITRRSAGLTTLLLSQVYAIITSFLKGMSDLRNRSLDEINLTAANLPEASAYARSITEVREFYLRKYQEELSKRNKLDRIDVVWDTHNLLAQDTSHFHQLRTISHKKARRASIASFLDREPNLFRWLDHYLEALSSCHEISHENQLKARELRKCIQRRTPSHEEWKTIQEQLDRWTSEFGMMTSQLPSPIVRQLSNPVMIIDEIQDFAQVEWMTLIRLFFHLLRKPGQSRLVCIGDQAQQVTPSGFRWPEIFSYIQGEADFLKFDNARYDRRFGFHNPELGQQIGPYLALQNNYRTSEEIAYFAHELGKGLSASMYGDKKRERDHYVELLVDPERTLCCSDKVIEDYYSVPQEFREPKVVIAHYQSVLDAVRRYMQESPGDEDKDGLIFITENPTELENDIGAEGVGVACHSPYSCKGLEFRGVNLIKMPHKELFNGKLDIDIVAQWYCSVTRPRVMLALFLSPEELEDLCRLGWPKELLELHTICNNGNVATEEQCLEVLRGTKTPEMKSWQLAERYLRVFLENPSIEWRLERAISILEELDYAEDANRFRRIGAEAMEERKKYAAARLHYTKMNDWISCARCYRRELDDAHAQNNSALVKEIEIKANNFAEEIETSAANAYEVWAELQNYQRAVDICLKHNHLRMAESMARKIVEPMPKADALEQLARKYRVSGIEYLPDAYYIFFNDLKDLEKCSDIKNDLKLEKRYDLLRQAFEKADLKEELADLGNSLAADGQLEQAAACLYAANYFEQAAQKWQSAASHLVTRISELCGIDINDSSRHWYRVALQYWIEKMLDNALEIDLPTKLIDNLQELKSLIQRGLLPKLSHQGESFWRQQIKWASEHYCNSDFWLHEANSLAEDIETRVGFVVRDPTPIENLISTIRDRCFHGCFPKEIDELRKDFLDVVFWYEDQVLEHAREIWKQGYESANSNLMESAYRLERQVCGGWYRRKKQHGQDDHELEQRVLSLWSNGNTKEMLFAARCWSHDEFTARRLMSRIETGKPGLFRSKYYSAMNRWEIRELSIREWAQLMCQINEIYPPTVAKEQARAALEKLKDSEDCELETRSEAKVALSEFFSDDGNIQHQLGSKSGELSALFDELDKSIADLSFTDNLRELRAFFDATCAFHKIGALNRQTDSWSLLKRLLRNRNEHIDQLIREIDRQLPIRR